MTTMTHEYEIAVNQLCQEIGIDTNNLRVFPLRLTARVTGQTIAGFIDNPDYGIMDYGSDKPAIIMHGEDVEIKEIEFNGQPVRYGYCETLKSLIVDEKWLNDRAKELLGGD